MIEILAALFWLTVGWLLFCKWKIDERILIKKKTLKCEVCDREFEWWDGYEIRFEGEVIWNYCSRVCIAKHWHEGYLHFVASGFITEEDEND